MSITDDANRGYQQDHKLYNENERNFDSPNSIATSIYSDHMAEQVNNKKTEFKDQVNWSYET